MFLSVNLNGGELNKKWKTGDWFVSAWDCEDKIALCGFKRDKYMNDYKCYK